LPPRPYVLLSCATSADGYLDDASPRRLILSGPADLDRVDEVRAGCDAIARIPISGSASSLNAASAATVLLYEAARQRA